MSNSELFESETALPLSRATQVANDTSRIFKEYWTIVERDSKLYYTNRFDPKVARKMKSGTTNTETKV